MTVEILNKALELIAAAAYRAELYPTKDMARRHLVTGTPSLRTSDTRDAIIEAIAIKGLDPNQSTEDHFRHALGEFLRKDSEDDQAYPGKLDKFVTDAVRAITEERILGKKSAQGVGTSGWTK